MDTKHEANLSINPENCPNCGHKFDCDSSLFTPGDPKPSPGDITVCIRCGEFMRFDQQMHRVPLTVDEFVELSADIRGQLNRIREVILEMRAPVL